MLTFGKMTAEYEVNPLGIDVLRPGLGWQLRSERSGRLQTAYRVLVAGSPETLDQGIGDCWDSGKVASGESQHIIYEGTPAESRKRYCWKVKVWDNEGEESVWSETAWWETGLLSPEDWQARWITAACLPEPEQEPDLLRDTPVIWDHAEAAAGDVPGPGTEAPAGKDSAGSTDAGAGLGESGSPAADAAVMLGESIPAAAERDAGQAVANTSSAASASAGSWTASGLLAGASTRRYFRLPFELPADGEQPTEAYLQVHATDALYVHVNGHDEGLYYPYMQVVTLDIGDLLVPGRNAIACAMDGEKPGVAAHLRLKYACGRTEMLTTESGGWLAFDRLEDGWTEPGFDESHWREATEVGRFGHGDWSVYKRILYPVNKGYWPCPQFRTVFRVEKPLGRARLYISALGIYRGYLNGQPINDEALAPGWTDYRQHIPYQTCDLTDVLLEGDNELSAIVGPGWYAGHLGICGPYHYGTKVGLRAQLELEYADGTRELVFTDGASWAAAESAVVSADIYMGETFDARRLDAEPDWQPAVEMVKMAAAEVVSDATGEPVSAEAAPNATGESETETSGRLAQAPEPQRQNPFGAAMSARRGPPIRPVEELAPRSVTRMDEETHVVDMGQNFTGWVRLRFENPPAGSRIRIRYAERLDADGSLHRANLRTAKQTDVYIAAGHDVEVYEPGFTYHGFQYVEISGYRGTLVAGDVWGVAIYSAAENVSDIETSHPSLNQLLSNIRWSQKGNFIGIPLDCPQRDERLGWLGDAHAFARTATYNMNLAGFFGKWQRDIRDAQNEAGAFPDIAPFVEHFGHGHVFFADGGVIMPWILYRVYGDTRFILDNYEAMARWIEWMKNDCDDKLVRRIESFGDHLSVGAETPPPFMNAVMFAYCAQLMAWMSEAIGRKQEAAEYRALFERLRASFQDRFVREDGRVGSGSQTSYVLALKVGLLPEALRDRAFGYLLEDIRSRGWHLTTGFMGVADVLPVLSERGATEDAYRLLLQESFPSWMYSVGQGATTMWERWDGWTEERGYQDPEMNSFNHYALGSVGEWIYRYAAGIDLTEESAGFRTFRIRPQPGGGLTWLRCRYETLYGDIVSSWKIDDGNFSLQVEIPANTEALVTLPGSEQELRLGSGQYAFSVSGHAVVSG